VPEQLEELGYRIDAYSLTLLSAAVCATREGLQMMKAGRYPSDCLRIVGFDDYFAVEARYAAPTGGAKAAKTPISRRRAAE